jgi:AraC-like DNA-binding protein
MNAAKATSRRSGRTRRPQPKLDPDKAGPAVVVLAERYASGAGPWHRHGRAQLIHASDGVLTVRTREGLWVVPPQRAVWLLPAVEHQVSSSKAFSLCTLYARANAVELPTACCVVGISPLVAELLRAAADGGLDYASDSSQSRLIAVILDHLPRLAVPSLHLPLPRDARLRRITDALTREPTDQRSLDAWSADAGCTARTAARLFLRETRLSFGQWRQQLRLLVSLNHLGRGKSVNAAALEVGYRDVSSYIAMFKRAFGETPGKFFRDD